jgi:hypothetical protein
MLVRRCLIILILVLARVRLYMLFSIYHNLSGSLYFIGYEVSEQMHIHLFFVMTQIHSKIMLLMHSIN